MKKTVRTIVDILMFLSLPILMGGFRLVPEDVIPVRHFHVLLGKLFFGLWLVHFILNRKWYTALFKGRYNLVRIFQMVVNVGMLVLVLALLFSSIHLMRHAGPISLARDMHLLGSHWLVVFAALHMGMHLDRLYKKLTHPTFGLVSQVAVGLLGAYGIYAFITHKLYLYLFAQTMFFNNYAENGVMLYLFDAIAIIMLFANIGYYTMGALRRK